MAEALKEYPVHSGCQDAAFLAVCALVGTDAAAAEAAAAAGVLACAVAALKQFGVRTAPVMESASLAAAHVVVTQGGGKN